jgi:hypothetical protein
MGVDASNGAIYYTIPTALTQTNAHVYGGSILLMQQPAMTTTAGRMTPFTILVALSPEGTAAGNLYWDDGEQLSMSQYINISYTAYKEVTTVGTSLCVYIEVMHNSYPDSGNYIYGTLTVMGINESEMSMHSLKREQNPKIKEIASKQDELSGTVTGLISGVTLSDTEVICMTLES